jgi:hypothetical protein
MRFSLLLAVLGISVGCADFHRGPAPKDATPPIATDAALPPAHDTGPVLTADAEPVDVEPVDVEPVDAEPVDAELVDSKPVALPDVGPDVGPETSVPDAAPVVEDQMFEVTVYPILLLRCEDCHKPGKEGAYTKFVLSGNARFDRQMVLDLVVPGNPEASLLLQRARGEWHTGGIRLSPDSSEYEKVSNWISFLDEE